MINYKNIILNTLSNSAILLNKKLVLTLGIENAWFVSYLIDQYKYYVSLNKIDKDDSFFATDQNLSLYTTLPIKKISKIKKAMKELKIIDYVVASNPTRTKYYINFDEIFRILNSDKSQEEIAKEKAFYEINEIEIDMEMLMSWRKSTLKEYCKQNSITYNGNDTKESLIRKILKKNTKEIEIKEQNDSVPKMGTLKNENSVSPKREHQCRPNGNTIVSPKREHITHNKKHIIKNTYHDSEIFLKKMGDEKGKIKAILAKYNINFNNEVEKAIKKLNISNIEILCEYLEKICKNILRNSNVKYKTSYFLACLNKLDENIYTEITRKNKEKEELDKKEKKEIQDNKIVQKDNEKFNKVLSFYYELDKKRKEDFINQVEDEYKKSEGVEMFKQIANMKKISTEFYLRIMSKFCYKIINKSGNAQNLLNL